MSTKINQEIFKEKLSKKWRKYRKKRISQIKEPSRRRTYFANFHASTEQGWTLKKTGIVRISITNARKKILIVVGCLIHKNSPKLLQRIRALFIIFLGFFSFKRKEEESVEMLGLAGRSASPPITTYGRGESPPLEREP